MIMFQQKMLIGSISLLVFSLFAPRLRFIIKVDNVRYTLDQVTGPMKQMNSVNCEVFKHVFMIIHKF